MPAAIGDDNIGANRGRFVSRHVDAEISRAGERIQFPVLSRGLEVVGDKDVEVVSATGQGPAFDGQRWLVVDSFGGQGGLGVDGVECPAVTSVDQRVNRAAALAGNRIAGQQSTEPGQFRFERFLLPFQWKLGQLKLADFLFWQDGPIAVIVLAPPVIDTIKDRLDPVIIGLRKRIEFMVMTAATVDS